MLEIQLPAIHRARSAALADEEHPEPDGASGLSEDHVLRPVPRRLRTVACAPPPEPDDVRPDADLVQTEEHLVSIDDLLVWEGTDEKGPIDARIGRLAWLVGIAAVVIVVLVLVFAAGTDVASVFRILPGS